jgi:thermitase
MLYQKKLFIIAVVSSIFWGIPTFAQYVSPSMPEVVDEYALWGNQLYVSDELIVKFKPTKVNLESSRGMMVMNTFADVQWIAVEETIVDANITVFSVDSDEDLFQKIQELEANPNVEYAQPNFIYNIQSYQPNDTHFSLQRWLQNIGQNIWGSIGTSGADIKRTQAMDIRSWNQNISTTGTVVAIIDDGLWYTHPDLSGQLRDGNTCVSATWSPLGGCLFGYDFFAMDKDPTPHGTDTHGTHVAGIVGAKTNNAVGVAWTNPWAKIMALRAASGNVLTTSVIVQAIAFAQRNGAKIINASWWW